MAVCTKEKSLKIYFFTITICVHPNTESQIQRLYTQQHHPNIPLAWICTQLTFLAVVTCTYPYPDGYVSYDAE